MRHGVRQLVVGAAYGPFAITVKPNVVLAPAARLPLGFMVIALPLESRLGVPLQVVEASAAIGT